MSALSQIAKDPSCLLAVDALQGGRWLSCIRPDGVQPSSVQRNFAEEQETWYSFDAVQKSVDLTHDFTFEIEFENTVQNNARIFYISSTESIFGLYLFSSGMLILTTNLLQNTDTGKKYAEFQVNPPGPFLTGRHTVKLELHGAAATLYLDGAVKETLDVDYYVRCLSDAMRAPASAAGYLYSATLTDDTGNTMLWRYPSWEERTRLLTFNNITTAGGVFRAADDAKVAGINTPLDFRGNTTSKTFIVRAFCPAHDPASEKLYIHPFFGQGQISSGATAWTFQFSLWEECRSGKSSQLFPAVSTGTDAPGANITGVDGYLNQWHTYAMVVDYTGVNCYIRVFVDGTMIRERIVSGTPVWNTPAATTTQETTVGIRRDPNASYYVGSMTIISAALIFNRALTASEIAALSYAVV